MSDPHPKAINRWPFTLLVDPDPDSYLLLSGLLGRLGLTPRLTKSLEEARLLMQQGEVVVAFISLKLPEGAAWRLLTDSQQMTPSPKLILMNASGTLEVERSMALGANYYLEKPFTRAKLKQAFATLGFSLDR
ncbi:response regulator [Spirosoma jeollabukense]